MINLQGSSGDAAEPNSGDKVGVEKVPTGSKKNLTTIAQVIKTTSSRIPRKSNQIKLAKTTSQEQQSKPINILVTVSSNKSQQDPMSPPILRPQPIYKQFHLGMFEIGRPLGKGKFGRVYLVRERSSGYVCALKTLYKAEFQQFQMEKQVCREVEIQTNLCHPNILKLYGHFHDQKRIFLVLEFAAEGELYKKLRKETRFTESKAARYTAQMASALQHMHRKHVIHRDIKPENILIGIHGELKLSDFGWSVHAPNTRRLTKCGTLDYLPPEMCDPRRSDQPYDEKVDIWSLGVLLYEFLVGEAPFEDSPILTQKRITKGDMKIPSFVSPQAKDLIERVSLLASSLQRVAL